MVYSNLLCERIAINLKAVRNLGPLNYAAYKRETLRLRSTLPISRLVYLRSKHASHPLACRPGTSDLAVFNQIFIQREYQCLDNIDGVGLIIDCGANVGYSAAYFLSRFSGSSLVAVEPDPGNFAILQQNLRPYWDRASLIQSGVWSNACGLIISSGSGDGREWGRTVRECRPGEIAEMMATDVGSLLDSSGFERISILKVDVEGAEKVIFSPSCSRWIDRVENIVIELHGDECGEVFLRAIKGLPFEISRCGELTVCKRKA